MSLEIFAPRFVSIFWNRVIWQLKTANTLYTSQHMKVPTCLFIFVAITMTPYTNVLAQDSSSQHCIELKNFLNNLISDASKIHCNNNLDCADFGSDCPFGCVQVGHVKFKKVIQDKKMEYVNSCTPCDYRCASNLFPVVPKCEEGKCINSTLSKNN